MKEKLNAIVTEAMAKLEKVEQLDVLNDIRVNYLGKKGELTSVLKSMKDVAPEDRPAVGQMVNDARIKLENKNHDNILDDEICELYKDYECKQFDLTYSVANSGKKSEIMFLSDKNLWPHDDELKQKKIRINIRKRCKDE